MLASPAPGRAADPDWKAVEQALGKAGQLQDGDVFRVGMPRTDLTVTVKGVPVKAGFALGSYAAFKQMGDHAMVMGDPVLLDQEVPAVISVTVPRVEAITATGDFVLLDQEVNPVARTLRQHGVDVTAIHNHGLLDTPRLFYMHFWAVDAPAKLAQALKAALDQTNSRRCGDDATANRG
jgi:hypothetical protein